MDYVTTNDDDRKKDSTYDLTYSLVGWGSNENGSLGARVVVEDMDEEDSDDERPPRRRKSTFM
jgi:hypothetical protein